MSDKENLKPLRRNWESDFCDGDLKKDENDGVLIKCVVKSRGGEGDSLSPKNYYIKAHHFEFNGVEIKCLPNDKIFCGLTFEALDSITMRGSGLFASSIDILASTASFSMEADSFLTVSDYGHYRGNGYSSESGASYAGQGGTQNPFPGQYVYGKFSQEPFSEDYHRSQMGSGNNRMGYKSLKRGGGVIVLKMNSGRVEGKLSADGGPTMTKEVSEKYDAGSGGYIYVNCTQSCELTNSITASGGYGSDIDESNAGSGGRIVFNNIASVDLTKVKVNGGCTNIPTSSDQNGAAGTIYFSKTKKLYIKNTMKCIASLRTVLDPREIEEENVESIYVSDQATLAFDNRKISRNQLDSVINNIYIENSTFSNPIPVAEQVNDLGKLNITIKGALRIYSSKFLHIAVDTHLNANKFFLSEDSSLKYHTNLWINSDSNFNISGIIRPNEGSGVEDGSPEPTVYINAGVAPPFENKTDIVQLGQNEYFFWNTSKIIGYHINIFSDHNLTLMGSIENTVENNDMEWRIINSCRLRDNYDEDVFRCVYQGFNQVDLTQESLLDSFNHQFNRSRPKLQEYLKMVPYINKDYSVYIQSLQHINLDGQIIGNRIGLCSSHLNLQGSINATEGGCKAGAGDGAGSEVKCCNHAGGSYGGSGVSGTPNTNEFECRETPEEVCEKGAGTGFGTRLGLAFQGSGGLGSRGGSGGGAIWLHASDELNLNGTIEANGGNSRTESDSSFGAGGGSGGSINVITTKIVATPDTALSVAGGFGNFGGGGGSGGWINGVINRRGNSVNNTIHTNRTLGWSGIFNISGGLSLNRGYNSDRSYNLRIEKDNTGTVGQEVCEKGFEGAFCSPCVMGFYKKERGFSPCQKCSQKPEWNSIYSFKPGEQTEEKCDYECFSSVPNWKRNPHCYDSFTWFIETIGGWVVLVVIISFITICIFFLWLYIRMKARKRELNKTKYSFNNLELNDKRKILEDDEFTTADLPFQICRAYFRGTNMIGNPWNIPIDPPQKLKNLIYNSAYEEFINQLNNSVKWKKKDRYCYYIIAVLFPPFLPLFTYKRRKKKFRKLRSVAADIQKGIWLNNSEKRRVNYVAKTIKISASSDYTMAYMDFLDIEKDREFYNGPALPMTFHLSGNGYFNTPLNLSYKDCLVRSLSLLDRTENFIEIYIENLNSHLKSLSFFEFLSFSESKFWDLIRFLHSNNEGILKKRSIKAELAILEYKSEGSKTIKKKSSKRDANGASQTYIFHFDFISKYPQTVGHIVEYCRFELFTRRTDIKLAIVFSRLDQSTIIPTNSHLDIQAASPSRKNPNGSIMTINERFNSTKISDVSIPPFYKSREDSSEGSDEDEDSGEYDQMFSGLKSKWAEPLLIKGTEKTSKTQQQDSFSGSGSAYSQASYCPNKVEVEDYEGNEELEKMLHDDNPLNDFKNRRHSRGCCFKFKISMISFLKMTFLRSSLPPKYPMLNLSIMIVLLFLDISAAMMIFLLYEQKEENQVALIPFAFIYPLGIVLSPLIACASIFVCKSSFYRIFLNLNALTCLTNVSLTFLVELAMAFFIGTNTSGQMGGSQTIEPILLLMGKIVLKILMAYFACKQLAFNDNHAYWSNKYILETINKNVTKENTRDYVSGMFERGSEDED